MQNIRLSIPHPLVENYGFAYNKHMGNTISINSEVTR